MTGDALDPQTLAKVAVMFELPVRWQAAPPGTLDRSIPKLPVAGLRETREP